MCNWQARHQVCAPRRGACGGGSACGSSGNGTGGSSKTIKGEFSANGVENKLSHERGVISMARSMRPDSAGSQFFIMHKDAPHLDGQYAAFGKMTDGFDVLDAIATVATDRSDRPREGQKIKHITVVEE